jgi:hypothetical protein
VSVRVYFRVCLGNYALAQSVLDLFPTLSTCPVNGNARGQAEEESRCDAVGIHLLRCSFISNLSSYLSIPLIELHSFSFPTLHQSLHVTLLSARRPKYRASGGAGVVLVRCFHFVKSFYFRCLHFCHVPKVHLILLFSFFLFAGLGNFVPVQTLVSVLPLRWPGNLGSPPFSRYKLT